MVYFETEHFYCGDMSRKDVCERCKWDFSDEPLISFYTLSCRSSGDCTELYKKWKKKKRMWFCFEQKADATVGGILSLRRINRLRKKSRLGIVVNPLIINQGFGTEMIRGFLGYYFQRMKYRTLVLDVAAFNKRALRCYEKCGFKRTRKFWKKYPGSDSIMDEPEFSNMGDLFSRGKNCLKALYIDMKITQKDWSARSIEHGYGLENVR